MDDMVGEESKMASKESKRMVNAVWEKRKWILIQLRNLTCQLASE